MDNPRMASADITRDATLDLDEVFLEIVDLP
jgi:hypothetical protein